MVQKSEEANEDRIIEKNGQRDGERDESTFAR